MATKPKLHFDEVADLLGTGHVVQIIPFGVEMDSKWRPVTTSAIIPAKLVAPRALDKTTVRELVSRLAPGEGRITVLGSAIPLPAGKELPILPKDSPLPYGKRDQDKERAKEDRLNAAELNAGPLSGDPIFAVDGSDRRQVNLDLMEPVESSDVPEAIQDKAEKGVRFYRSKNSDKLPKSPLKKEPRAAGTKTPMAKRVNVAAYIAMILLALILMHFLSNLVVFLLLLGAVGYAGYGLYRTQGESVVAKAAWIGYWVMLGITIACFLAYWCFKLGQGKGLNLIPVIIWVSPVGLVAGLIVALLLLFGASFDADQLSVETFSNLLDRVGVSIPALGVILATLILVSLPASYLIGRANQPHPQIDRSQVEQLK